MKRTITIGLAATLGLLGACAEGADERAELEGTEMAAPPTVEPPTATEGQQPGGAALAVGSLQGGETYLTDGSGRALYLLEGEPQGQSTCHDACAEEWPPFLAPGGAPTAAAAVQSGLIGTLQRPDGSTQVTYGGHALYYYHDDRGPGETKGQDVTDQWGEWYLVRPGGEPLEGHGAGEASR